MSIVLFIIGWFLYMIVCHVMMVGLLYFKILPEPKDAFEHFACGLMTVFLPLLLLFLPFYLLYWLGRFNSHISKF